MCPIYLRNVYEFGNKTPLKIILHSANSRECAAKRVCYATAQSAYFTYLDQQHYWTRIKTNCNTYKEQASGLKPVHEKRSGKPRESLLKWHIFNTYSCFFFEVDRSTVKATEPIFFSKDTLASGMMVHQSKSAQTIKEKKFEWNWLYSDKESDS